jgi:vacuolar-type H+-ATPase subunit C/Vma6
MCPDTTRAFLEAYFERFFVEDVKRIIRPKYSGAKVDKSSIIPLPKKYEYVDLEAMSEAPTLQDALDMLKNTRFKSVLGVIPIFQKYGLISLLEAFIDKTYYDSEVSPNLEAAPDTESVKEFLGAEVDLQNIRTILDLKARGVPQEVIRSSCPKPVMLKREELTLILSANLDTIPEIVSRTRYGSISQALRDALDVQKDESLERIIRSEIYRRTKLIMTKHAESLAYVLGYVREIEAEANNLVSIVIGKELDVSEPKIEMMLSL